MMDKAQMLADCLGGDATVREVTFRGRKYVVTRGTGEMNFGADGGGAAAFAYAVSDLRAADLRGDDWEYSAWCNTVSVVTDRGLAKKCAREYGYRLTEGGSCKAVLDDATFARLTV